MLKEEIWFAVGQALTRQDWRAGIPHGEKVVVGYTVLALTDRPTGQPARTIVNLGNRTD